MRFHKEPSPPRFLNRRDEARLLALIALLVIVLVAMKVAARPSSWYWLTGRPDAGADVPGSQQTTSPATIDFGIRAEEEDEPLPPCVFRSRREPTDSVKPMQESSVSPPPQDEAKSSHAADTGPHASTQPPVIDPAWLADVQDNMFGIRRAEKDSHDRLLALARNCSLDILEQSANWDVDFTVLMLESERFRGKLVGIEGDLRRLMKFPAAENDYGLADLYEAWVFTRSSGSNPYRVVCTSVPEGLPQGMTIDPAVRVRVAGYFFKRYGYATADGRIHAAPVVLASSPRRMPTPLATVRETDSVPFILGILVPFGLVVGFALWRFRVSDKRFRRQHLKHLPEGPSDAIASLSDLPTHDPAELLRQLAKSESQESNT